MNRRTFVQAGTAAVPAMLLLNSRTAFGYQANSAIRHGLLGCGNRGSSVADSFSQNTEAHVVALADLLPDQLAAGKAHYDKLNAGLGRAAIDSRLTFHGAHAYEQLAASPDVDLIQISTPPFFHVQHLEAAVASGKHVYCEKPVGIDVRQARQALEIAKRVKPDQSVAVGFQCRNAPPIAAAAEKIKAGALGQIGLVAGYYNAPASTEKTRPGITPDEYRVRNWLWDRALSGDILVEQNIHIIDLVNQVLGSRPLKAIASGGRAVLNHWGDCWDNYQVDYTYPGDIRFSFSSSQFGDYGVFEAGFKIFGSKAAATIQYAGPIEIRGPQPWKWQDSDASTSGSGKFAANGAFEDNLEFADRDKERSFIASITSGNAENQIASGVETALSCMLGRMAGYQHREVTWEDLLAQGETYELGIKMDQFA